MEIKNLKKAAKRILKAVKNRERFVLYGDADLDGVSSVIILRETIKNLGGEISAIYFPDRETEGYGVSKEGLNYLKKFSPALLIALDCGISNFEEIAVAKKLGFDVIIIDHHEVLDKLPKADIIVDPKQKVDKYPFKGLATAGIAFKFSEILLEKKFSENLKRDFLELVALATLADTMPRESENKALISEGLSFIENSWRPGLRALFHLEYFNHHLTFEQKVFKIISVLNVRDVENNFPASFRLLTFTSQGEAENLIEKLIKKNEQRRERIQEIVREIEERILKKEEGIIFEGDSNWDFTLISIIASIFCQKYKKPCFIFSKKERESQGTVRTPPAINSISLMTKCKKYLITYGGHSQASGFRIKNENLEKFKRCLLKQV